MQTIRDEKRMNEKMDKRTGGTVPGAWLGLVVLIIAGLLQPGDAGAKAFKCDGNQFLAIITENDRDREFICLAAERAVSFLAAYDLHLKHPVSIEMVDRPIDSNGYIAFGSYDRRMDLIRLMSYQAIISAAQPPQMYDQPFDLEHYQGAVAHEVTHAIFEHNSRGIPNQKSNATQEYLAHATQLGVLNVQRRQAIIAAQNVGPWESGDSISEIYMAFNPTGFAVKSYLHLTQLEEPLPFIKMLLNHNWFYFSVP